MQEKFRRIGDAGEWRSCYIHDELGIICIVYVDDFKMAGSEQGVKAGWKLLREGENAIMMDNPKTVDQYLGCTHKIVNHTLPDGTEITRVEWDMENFLIQCVDSYKELAGVDTLEYAEVPFIPEDDYGNVSRKPASGGEGLVCPWCEGSYPKERYAEWKPGKAGGKTDPAKNPPKERTVGDEGHLAGIAAKVIMKIFYASRNARFDTLRAVSYLACHITRWTLDCDKRLHRLVCYINSTLDYRQCGWTDGDLGSVRLSIYADADFAGCQRSNKSTTGGILSIEGKHTKFPIAAMAKGQTCVSHSTPEA